MLRITHNGREYAVGFRYAQRAGFQPGTEIDFDNLVPWDRKGPCITVCEVRVGDIDSLDKDKELIGRGRAVQNPGDNFTKEFGRKESMTRALEPVDRAVRTDLWAAYHNRNNVPAEAEQPVLAD